MKGTNGIDIIKNKHIFSHIVNYYNRLVYVSKAGSNSDFGGISIDGSTSGLTSGLKSGLTSGLTSGFTSG